MMSSETSISFMKENSSNMSDSEKNKVLEDIIGESQSLVKGSSKKSTTSSSLMDPRMLKLELHLTEREIELIRDSWFIMLNDDLSPQTMAAFYGKLRQNKKISLTANLITNEKFNVMNQQYEENRKRLIKDKSIPYQISNTSTIEGSLFCAQFYENLIAMDQNVERMFPSIRHQAVSFSGVLNTAVDNLENIHVLDSYLRGIGKRHSRILGIKPAYFETMGKAFIRTFQDRFGIFFTIELEDIWSRLYSYLANGMIAFGVDPVLPQSIKSTRANSLDTLRTTSSGDASLRNSSFSKAQESDTSDYKTYMAQFNCDIVEEDDLDFPIPEKLTTETSINENDNDVDDVKDMIKNFGFNMNKAEMTHKDSIQVKKTPLDSVNPKSSASSSKDNMSTASSISEKTRKKAVLQNKMKKKISAPIETPYKMSKRDCIIM